MECVRQGPLRVLVVDDSEFVLAAVRDALTAEGILVDTRAEAYGSAWDIVHKSPDVVLLDVNMPGIPGQDIVSIVRTRSGLGDTKILLFSSEPPEKLEALTRQCGADGWIAKTSNHAALAETIRREATRGSVAAAAPVVTIADGDASWRGRYPDLLEEADFRLDVEGNGDELWRRLSHGTPPDLVVTELELASLTGEQVYRRAIRHDPSWTRRFIFVTGSASRVPWITDFINGTDARVLHKPVSDTHLTAAINGHLAALQSG